MLNLRHGILARGDDEILERHNLPYYEVALEEARLLRQQLGPRQEYVTKKTMNARTQVGPDGVVTEVHDVVEKKKHNNVGREEQIAQMLPTRGLVRGSRATARSKVMPLEAGQKRETLIQVMMEEWHRQREDVAVARCF